MLEHAVGAARGFRVARTVGVESEMELPFAALQHLCAPILSGLVRLPGPQRDALAELELELAGIEEEPDVLLADAGYWHNEQMDNVTASWIRLLCPPEAATRQGTRPGWNGGRYSWMRYVLATELGQQLYKKRKVMIEPVFAQMK